MVHAGEYSEPLSYTVRSNGNFGLPTIHQESLQTPCCDRQIRYQNRMDAPALVSLPSTRLLDTS